ncbi:hypothetical protein V8F33_009123 [Rhypophila sp. PSN 637]
MSSAAAGPLPPDTPGILTPRPIETPTHGPPGAGSFTVGCSTIIAAAPLICLDVVLNSSKYPEWNRFCRKCTIDSQPRPRPKQQDDDDDSSPPTEGTNSSPVLPDHLVGPDYYLKLGTKFTFDVHMNPLDDLQASSSGGGRATALEVSVLEPINEVVPAAAATPPSSSISSSTQSHHWRRRRSSSMSGASIPVSEGGASERRKYTRRTGWRVAWKMQTHPLFLPGWMLRSERVQEFVELDDAASPRDDGPRCEYTCWETFYGVLAPVVRLSVGNQLTKGFNTWMVDLKRRAEEIEGAAFAPVSNSSE